jgi:hypothetical protein
LGAGDSGSWQIELRRAVALSLVPAGVALVFGLLLLPRRAVPDSVPLPIPDSRVLARTHAADAEFADRARREPLPAAVRALGSALRDFHTQEANGGDVGALGQARQAIDASLTDALPGGAAALLELRAVEMEIFVTEVRRFESSGAESDELKAVAGGFVRSMRNEGWIEGRRVAPGPSALRAMYKQMWNTFLGLDARPPFELLLDEQRALYAFYLLRPHASPAMREAIASARRGGRGPGAGPALDEAERIAVETWRLDRISRISAMDPLYPAAYARGSANLRRGDRAAAATAFRDWLAEHPDGPLALRAQNYLRLALSTRELD